MFNEEEEKRTLTYNGRLTEHNASRGFLSHVQICGGAAFFLSPGSNRLVRDGMKDNCTSICTLVNSLVKLLQPTESMVLSYCKLNCFAVTE